MRIAGWLLTADIQKLLVDFLGRHGDRTEDQAEHGQCQNAPDGGCAHVRSVSWSAVVAKRAPAAIANRLVHGCQLLCGEISARPAGFSRISEPALCWCTRRAFLNLPWPPEGSSF